MHQSERSPEREDKRKERTDYEERNGQLDDAHAGNFGLDGTIVYDFEDESQVADWFEVPTLDGAPYTAQYSVENGDLVGFCSDPSIVAGQGLGVGDDTWRDYTFETQLKLEQAFPEVGAEVGAGSTAFVVVHYHLSPGIVYQHLPPNETDGTVHWGVWVGFNSEGLNLVKWGSAIGGAYTPGKSIDLPLEENRWYTVRIESEGNHYRMFLDGKLAVEDDACSPEHTYGIPGFALRNCEARFDNVIITGDSIPNMLSVAAVSPRSRLATTWGRIRK
jgi:hypothetical protein